MRNNLTINDHKKLLKDLGQQKYNKEILSRYEKLKSSNAVNFTFKDAKGILYALKDNYAVKDSVVSASTRILESHNPRYNSTVYKLLKNKDFNPLFISNMDELAMGGKGIYSKRKPVQNSFDKKLISGGSSSGSAFLVGSNIVPFAIGSDTGDSVIKPSALNRIIGFKPTWSSVSRYGLYDYSPAFDHVGWFTNNVDDSILLANDLIKKDNRDQSNTEHPIKKFSSDKSKIKKVAVIKDLEKFITDSDIRKN
ncbi:MAG: Asp-tRNA(Asn)/Glu-tRNA(Gln) amidotransferase subunit GatA, partial [Mycoplasmataceae bacterium]|nr:Asp-tRNA(Asn)/Glu-tRNA(Gln) amidotransferase subunit GatA [Mycoplasmataceae bacterium]